MYFQQICEPPMQPPAGYVDVELKAVSLNAKDVYTMSGWVETRCATIALDFSGVITAVGPGLEKSDLQPGDRVVGLVPNHFTTIKRVTARSVHKMLDNKDFIIMPTLLTVYSIALFALRDRAQLRAGESILIHAGAGAFGLAAISMAQHMGATVYTTFSSEERRSYLVNVMKVPPGNIFNSRDSKFVDEIRKATGNGVNVIVNSLIGNLMHASWSCIAPFGRFVEIGKRELTDAGKLDMQVFLRNTTFTAFDLSEFYYTEDPYYRNPPQQPFQREKIHEDRRAVHVKCSLIDVAHGRFSHNSTENDATLIVFGFRFDPGIAGGRFTAATITVIFAGQSEEHEHPGVTDLSLNGTYSVLETIQTETTTQGLDTTVGVNVLNAGQLGTTRRYEKVVSRQVSDATYVSGTSCMIGVEWEPENAVEWKLRENASMQTGIPVYLQAGVLLKRSTQAPFQCTVEIDTKVDVRSKVKRWFGGKPRDDPVLFNPTMESKNRLMKYDLQNLGSFDLALVEEVTFTTVLDGVVKHEMVNQS
ncbi:hypothetical protein BDV06DRAFT_229035 [Aspergillus oleicola]